jgi:hypothetical protein
MVRIAFFSILHQQVAVGAVGVSPETSQGEMVALAVAPVPNSRLRHNLLELGLVGKALLVVLEPPQVMVVALRVVAREAPV